MRIEIPRARIAPVIDGLEPGTLLVDGVAGLPIHSSESGVPFFKGDKSPEVSAAICYVDGKFYWVIDDDYYINAPLYERPFIHKVFDCYRFLKDYFSCELGIALPDHEYEDDWWVSGKNYYNDYAIDAGFNPVTPPLQKGDVILLSINSPVPNHAAVYVGEGNIAHHLGGARSKIEPFRRGLLPSVSGYYRHRDAF